MTIGNYIKFLREKKKYSQRKLAIISDVSNTTISRIENELVVPDLETLAKIASALGITVEELLNNADDNNLSSTTKQDYDIFIENVKIQFMDASEKDRDAIYKKISELYWDAKERHDKKNGL